MSDGRRWKLHRSFTYHVGSEYSNMVVVVPAGSITDFASIPSIFWSLLPSWGKYGKAAVVHDWLYHQHNILSRGSKSSITRKEADIIFYEGMLVSGTRRWKAEVMYWAVRLFGQLAWRK